MAREEDVARTFATIDKELGRLTHLVYNAGTTGGYSRLEDADTAMMRSVLELNVLGALMCVKAAAARMSTKKGGQGGAIVLHLVDGRGARQRRRIRLVRGLERRDRPHDGRAVARACRRGHPRQRGRAGADRRPDCIRRDGWSGSRR